MLFGRLVPAVRTLISVPAGVAGMALPRFLLFSLIGSLIWAGALAVAGHALGENHEAVERYLGIASNIVIGGLVAWYLYRVIRWKA